LPPQPLSWFRALSAAFGHDLKIRVAFKDDLAVAAILTLSHKRSMTYKYGCSDARFNRFGGMPFLFWNTIQEAKDRGFEELDLGRSDTDNLGLIAFKEHLGATRTQLNYWTYPYQRRIGGSPWPKQLAHRLVPVVPVFALKALAGMYRHVG
jgi:lipid II:glycine glycyltransferase (peptidoglycan interpeptide bridge formation enzyme)